MVTRNDTTDKRDAKAQALIDAGKVHLLIGERYALVDGSHGEVYQVNRDGCTCPDWTNRQPEGGCGHMRAVRRICGLYRACRTIAREAGRATIPPQLGRALGMYRDVEAPPLRLPAELVAALGAPEPPPCPAHGEPLPCGVCDWERLERDMATRCMTCGEHLTADGQCPRRAERMAA